MKYRIHTLYGNGQKNWYDVTNKKNIMKEIRWLGLLIKEIKIEVLEGE